MNFFEQNKKVMFPDITDWDVDHNELRFAKDVNARPAKYYYFFHHMSYKITMYSFHILSFLIFAAITIYAPNTIISVIFAFLTMYKTYKLFRFIEEMRTYPNKNFYDIFLREYKW